jgi:hypothetical protein
MHTTRQEANVNPSISTADLYSRLLGKLFQRDAAYRRLGFRESELRNRREQLFYIACMVAKTGLQIPPLTPRETGWVRRAVVFIDNRCMPSDCPVSQAIATAARLDSMRLTCVPLMAALLAKGGSSEAVATAANLDLLVVKAFENLFFHARARHWSVRRRMLRNYFAPLGLKYRSPNLSAELELVNAGLRGNLGDVIGLSRQLGFTFFESRRSGEA